MQKVTSVLLAFLLLFTAVCAGGCTRKETAASVSPEDILILFTNDVHCGIDDDIGYAGLAAYKKELEKSHAYVTLVDCGDHVQGSYIGAVSKGECVIDMMNEVGYDFAIVGNHEFDFGMEQLAANIARAKAQYLCCNITYSGSGQNALAATAPCAVKTYGTRKVGFVGVTTPWSPRESTPAYFDEDGKRVYSFAAENDGQALYERVQAAADDCRRQGADYVVLLSHLGVDDADAPYTAPDVIAHTDGIDAVLDAHSHTELPCNVVKNAAGKEVLLSQAGTKLNNIGQLVISADGFLSVGYISDYPEKDARTDAFIKNIQSEYEARLTQVVARSDTELSCADTDGVRMVRAREVALGDLVADAYRMVGAADIGMCNGGGIRADLHAGDITYGDIISVNPFGNTLCVVKVTGAELLDMLEYFYRRTESTYALAGQAVGEDGSFQQVSGLKFTVDTSVPSSVETDGDDMLLRVGETRRVTDVQVLRGGTYQPIDPAAVYTLASHNHMIKNGGSGMGLALADHELVIDESICDYQVLIDYINSLDGDLSAYQTVDDRITVR